MNTRGALALMVVVACSSLPQVEEIGPTPSTPSFSLRASGRRLTLTAVDLAAYTAGGSTLDAVRQLRPEYLTPSGRVRTQGRAEIALYLNNAYDGGIQGLISIPLDAVEEIDFLHPNEAIQRFGSLCRCEGGAIVVTTKSLRRR
jgi:hypothetical protein